MKTLTPDQFKKKYGEARVQQFSATPESKPGYFSRVGSSIKENLGEAAQSEMASASGQMNPFAAGANIFKNVTGAAMAPIAQAPGLKQLGEGFSKAGQAIVDTPIGQKGTDWLSKQASPETLGAVSDTVEGGLNTFGLYGAVQGVKGAVQKTKNTVNSIKESDPGTPPPPDPQIRLNAAIKDATPDYESSTPTGKGKLLDRTQEGGFLKGRTVEPNALEIEAGTELSNVSEYNHEGTKLSKYQAAKTEVGKRGQALETDLGNEKVAVPKREVSSRVVKAVNEVPNRSLLLQASDPVIKSYIRVLKNALNKEAGNLKGVLRLRKILDDAYENARGKQAFGSDKISALDDVHTAARDALTKYLIEKAQNTKVQASLRSQWNLYRAIDMLRIAAEKESGSVLGRIIQQHPIATKVTKAVGNAIGIGQAINTLAP